MFISLYKVTGAFISLNSNTIYSKRLLLAKTAVFFMSNLSYSDLMVSSC